MKLMEEVDEIRQKKILAEQVSLGVGSPST
jgi:hypothetical protein